MCKIIVVGDPNSGKTSLINRYTHNVFQPLQEQSIGFDFQMKTIDIQNGKILLYIWDISGQNKKRSPSKSFY